MKYLGKIALILILVLVSPGYILANDKSKERPNKISIILDFIPDHVKPGDKPITLNGEILSQLFPEVKNPRLILQRIIFYYP